jgi:hypothetical protein
VFDNLVPTQTEKWEGDYRQLPNLSLAVGLQHVAETLNLAARVRRPIHNPQKQVCWLFQEVNKRLLLQV